MEDIKWTVTVLMQYYDKESFAHDEFIKLILKNSLNHDIIKFFIFKHDVLRQKAICYTARKTSNNDILLEIIEPEFSCADFFANAAKYWGPFLKKYPAALKARYNFVITTGHGAGFGFTDGSLEETKDLDNNKDEKPRNWSKLIQQLLGQGIIRFDREHVEHTLNQIYSYPDFSGGDEKAKINVRQFRIIPVIHVQEALATGFAGRKADFFYTGNCDMQLFETGYMLKEVVRYFAASETFQYPTGIDFEKLFTEMGNDAEKEEHLQSLAGNITDNIPLKYGDPAVINLLKTNIKNFDEGSVDYMSLSVNNLDNYEALRKELDKLSTWLLNNKSVNIFERVRRIRACCRDVAQGNPLGIIDIINLCMSLRNKMPYNAALYSVLDSITDFFKEDKQPGRAMVSGYFATKSRGSRSNFSVNPYGVTFFFPRDVKYFKDQYTTFFLDNFYRRNEYLTYFLANSSWDDFVLQYYHFFTTPAPMVNCP